MSEIPSRFRVMSLTAGGKARALEIEELSDGFIDGKKQIKEHYNPSGHWAFDPSNSPRIARRSNKTDAEEKGTPPPGGHAAWG